MNDTFFRRIVLNEFLDKSKFQFELVLKKSSALKTVKENFNLSINVTSFPGVFFNAFLYLVSAFYVVARQIIFKTC